MPPIRISLSLAPGSYFFCASAELVRASAARPAAASLRVFRFMVRCLQVVEVKQSTRRSRVSTTRKTRGQEAPRLPRRWASVAVDLAEQFPMLAVELGQPALLDRVEV